MLALRLTAVVALSGALALPAYAQQEVCPEGMVMAGKRKIGKRKQRRCCWPGQQYSAAQDQCVGVPSCPEDASLKGGTCVRHFRDPAKMKDIRRFLVLTGAVRSGMESMNQLTHSYQTIMPQVPEEFWAAYRQAFDEEQLLKLLAPIYDKHLSHEDIRGLLAFYESEAGRRYLRALPDIQRDARMMGQRHGQALARDLEQKLKAQGYVSPGQGSGVEWGAGPED